MTKTVLALYDDFETARRAVEALADAGFNRNDISLVANDAGEKYAGYIDHDDHDDGDVSSGEGAGFGAVVGGLIGLGVALIPGIGPVLAAGPLAALFFGGVGAVAGAATGGIVAGLVDLGMDEEDAEYYAEGIRRGGALVTVNLDADEHVERAEEILNRFDPVDVDERGETYRTSGWTGFDANAKPYTEQQVTDYRSSIGSGVSDTATVQPGEQQKLEVVEEQLNVGKREVQGDRVRVHTRVTERPVQEQVNLREEHVTVERHAVDRPASPADVNTFQEATIEVQERHEEPVVSKTAHVVEEVVVGKEATEHTETVQDTVRRKDVEIDGAVGSRSYTDYETRFRNAYSTRYASSGTWDEYSPAYRFGYDLANNASYHDYTWDRLETDAQTQWEVEHPNTWERFKGAIRDAWNEITGQR